MLAIDTNILVRYLANDHPTQSGRARRIVDGNAVFVPVTVVLEAEWVLRSAYDYPPREVVEALRSFGGLPTVSFEDAASVARALDLSERGFDLADALHLERSVGCDGFATFDRALVKLAGAAGRQDLQLI